MYHAYLVSVHMKSRTPHPSHLPHPSSSSALHDRADEPLGQVAGRAAYSAAALGRLGRHVGGEHGLEAGLALDAAVFGGAGFGPLEEVEEEREGDTAVLGRGEGLEGVEGGEVGEGEGEVGGKGKGEESGEEERGRGGAEAGRGAGRVAGETVVLGGSPRTPTWAPGAGGTTARRPLWTEMVGGERYIVEAEQMLRCRL